MKKEVENLVLQVAEVQSDIAAMKKILKMVDISVGEEKDKGEVEKLEKMIDAL
ncbi:hypothetical protein HOG17_02260 [Candidatus Peregrinibacteria bacterium]|jgi:hypothetical protein|nr:hypothetical protein [Candidatus Peregrinibacteria bacterium]MBT4147744.1 hypothetical protein [Candidatus Peregrinibacteria bacterium]MBT4365945.1 hypothetical protein [Candidatus Peregrinibacteria bacterium]MBT4456570.1 hypothetical protein [Candidatus Peregrinibacteria bacterium]